MTVASAITYGAYRGKIGTNELRAKLDAERLPINPSTYDAKEIDLNPVIVYEEGISSVDSIIIIG